MLINTSQKTELVKNFREMLDDIVVIKQRALRAEGVTVPGLFVMHYITNKGPQKLTDCSLNLGVSKPTITKIVDNLEKDGLVKRVRESSDRRTYHVYITKLGKMRLNTMSRILEGVLNDALENLSPEEIRTLNSTISSIRERIKSISN